MPWPAPAILIGHRRREAAFEQSVHDEIGRGPEQFLPGEEAARIRQPALLARGAYDRGLDHSAMDPYATRTPKARNARLVGSRTLTLMEQTAGVHGAEQSVPSLPPAQTGSA